MMAWLTWLALLLMGCVEVRFDGLSECFGWCADEVEECLGPGCMLNGQCIRGCFLKWARCENQCVKAIEIEDL